MSDRERSRLADVLPVSEVGLQNVEREDAIIRVDVVVRGVRHGAPEMLSGDSATSQDELVVSISR